MLLWHKLPLHANLLLFSFPNFPISPATPMFLLFSHTTCRDRKKPTLADLISSIFYLRYPNYLLPQHYLFCIHIPIIVIMPEEPFLELYCLSQFFLPPAHVINTIWFPTFIQFLPLFLKVRIIQFQYPSIDIVTACTTKSKYLLTL